MNTNYVRIETDAEKIKHLEGCLAECYKLTGADPDGDEDWRLAPHAVEEVRRLRQELEDAESKVIQLEGEIEDLKIQIPLDR